MVRRSRVGSVLCSLILLGICWATPLHAVPWIPFGPDGGDARRLATDPKDHNHLFLGTANGWIYESHDEGAKWVRLARVGKRDDLVLDSIVVDASDSQHLVVGAWVIDHADGGLFITHDGGKTWTNQAEMRGQSVRALAASRSDPKVMVAGTLQGVFRSVDGGEGWKLISPPDSVEIHNIQSLAIDPVDPAVIYAGTWHLPWKTKDAGEHWANMKEGIIDDSDVFSIIVDPLTPQTVYASACSGIYKSEDAGDQFRKIQGIPSSARRTRVLLQDPNDLKIVFAGTTEGLFRSEDAGKTWSRTTGPEITVNDVSVDSSNSRHVLIATNRGGVLSSDDGGDTFHSSNGGFSARQITTLKRDFQHPATLYVGVVNDKESGGVFQSDNGGLSWDQRSEGLEGRDVFSLGQAPDGTMIAGTPHGLFRLDTSAEIWVRVENAPNAPPAPEAAKSAAIIVRAPVNVGRNQFAKRNVAKATTTRGKGRAVVARGKSGRQAKVPASRNVRGKAHKTVLAKSRPAVVRPPEKSVVALADASTKAAPVTPAPRFDGSVYSLVTSGDTMLASTSIGLLKSIDNGVTWTLDGPHKSTDWRFLAAAKANVVAASLKTAQLSVDSGRTWTPISLPEELSQIAGIAVDPAGEVWVGGREGVFVSSNAGNSWSRPKSMYVNAVNSVFYDEPSNRVLVTAGGPSGVVFSAQLPGKEVSYFESGWSLRFARPVGDHLVAATLFDGIVVQPRMMNGPAPAPPSQASKR